MSTIKKRGTFPAGRSGNPRGRPVGSGDAAVLRAALADRMDGVMEVVILKALSGDMTAAGLLLARALPPLRPAGEVVAVRMGKGGLVDQARRVIGLMASGRVSDTQGQALVSSLAAVAKMKTIEQMTEQVDALQAEMEELKNAFAKNQNV